MESDPIPPAAAPSSGTAPSGRPRPERPPPDLPVPVSELPTPALLLDRGALETNLRRMAERTGSLGVSLRPHVKTHKCIEIGERQRALGARGITVSTLYEARVFARHGFRDITWAFPLIPSRAREAAALAGEIRLGITLDSREALEAAEATGAPLEVWIKVDCGYGRAGVDPGSGAALSLARAVAASSRLSLRGILTHSGHAYHAESPAEIEEVAEEERSAMVGFAERLRKAGISVSGISVGSTPAMARVRTLEGVTEARPGNYALYDYTQFRLGSCELADCAVSVLTTVVSRRAGERHAVTDAGALSLSKDTGPDGERHFGRIFGGTDLRELDPGVRVTSVSQEHGTVTADLPVGTRLRVLPNHSCLTVANFDRFHVVEGNEVVDRWKIWRGRD